MEKNYYDILGVKKDASQDDIKKAYRSLSKKWHPDKFNNKSDSEKKEAEEKFKDINEAYTILSDEQKRSEYDNGGSMFGGFNPFGMWNHGFAQKQQEPGDNLAINVYYELEDAYNGKNVKVNFTRNTRCHHCGGTGSKDGKTTSCTHCGGRGFVMQEKRTMGGFMRSITHCPHCNGTGKGAPVNPCEHCKGSGLIPTPVSEEITIPTGVFHGARMDYNGLGHESKDKKAPNGTMFVIFNEKPHNTFVRENDTLHYSLDLNLKEALLGCEKEIPSINGSKLNLKIPKLTPVNKVFRFQGKGMPSNTRFGVTYGDMHVRVNYKLPENLTKEQEEALAFFDN